MKKFLALCLWALCLTAALAARAEDAPPLPQGVSALLDAMHPEMTVAAYAGWGNDARGQFAAALTDGQGGYTLCVAEKGEADAAYALTVDNENALRDVWTPSLFFDTSDSLWISCHAPDDESSYGAFDQYSFEKGSDGVWRFRGLNHYDSHAKDATQIVEFMVSLGHGAIRYERFVEDENENILERREYAPIPVSEACMARMDALETFDLSLLREIPEYGIPVADGLCDGLLEDGDALLTVDLKWESLVMLVQKPGGARRLRVAEWDGAAYTVRETGDLPSDAELDTVHPDEESLELAFGLKGNGYTRMMGFRLLADGRWALDWLWAEEEMYFGVSWLSREAFAPGVYGAHPWSDLFAIDFSALPGTFDEALARLNSDGYALVNNPDPADRLHLRTKPDRSAASLGKFYNGTPVHVLERDGAWAHVRVGLGEASLEGYMMSEYLTFTADAAAAARAWPSKQLVDDVPLFSYKGVAVLRAPRADADIVHDGWAPDADGRIVGVTGDDWYVVMCDDGSVGYAQQALFWDGNG